MRPIILIHNKNGIIQSIFSTDNTEVIIIDEDDQADDPISVLQESPEIKTLHELTQFRKELDKKYEN